MDVGEISLLIHSMNRCYDLKKSMSSIVEAVNESPPMEIFVLDYSSTDDIKEYMDKTIKETKLKEGNYFTFMSVKGKKYYNSPNARNIAQLNSKGLYGIQWACDSYPRKDCFKVIRNLLEKREPVWMAEGWMGRAVVCRKDEFVDAGGYDERFDYYAPEDKDICLRLHRRGGKFVQFPKNLLRDTPTTWNEKFANLKKHIPGPQQRKRMVKMYEENIRNNVMEANKEAAWGV